MLTKEDKEKGLLEYEVHVLKMSKEVGKDGKKMGIVPGKYVGSYKHKGMLAPGQTIKVKGRNRRIRCVDLYDNERIILIEG